MALGREQYRKLSAQRRYDFSTELKKKNSSLGTKKRKRKKKLSDVGLAQEEQARESRQGSHQDRGG